MSSSVSIATSLHPSTQRALSESCPSTRATLPVMRLRKQRRTLSLHASRSPHRLECPSSEGQTQAGSAVVGEGPADGERRGAAAAPTMATIEAGVHGHRCSRLTSNSQGGPNCQDCHRYLHRSHNHHQCRLSLQPRRAMSMCTSTRPPRLRECRPAGPCAGQWPACSSCSAARGCPFAGIGWCKRHQSRG